MSVAVAATTEVVDLGGMLIRQDCSLAAATESDLLVIPVRREPLAAVDHRIVAAVRCGRRPAAAVRSRACGRAHSSSAPPGCSTDCRAQRIGVGAIVSPSDIRGLACSPMSSMPEPAPSGPRPAFPPIATYSSNWSVAGTARRRPQGSPGHGDAGPPPEHTSTVRPDRAIGASGRS